MVSHKRANISPLIFQRHRDAPVCLACSTSPACARRIVSVSKVYQTAHPVGYFARKANTNIGSECWVSTILHHCILSYFTKLISVALIKSRSRDKLSRRGKERSATSRLVLREWPGMFRSTTPHPCAIQFDHLGHHTRGAVWDRLRAVNQNRPCRKKLVLAHEARRIIYTNGYVVPSRHPPLRQDSWILGFHGRIRE